MIRLEPMPHREDSEEKGGYKGRDLPWRVRGSNQRLGAPILGSYTGGGGGLVGGQQRLTVGLREIWTYEEDMLADLSPRQGREGNERATSAAVRFPMATSVCIPAQAEQTLHLTYSMWQCRTGSKATMTGEKAWIWDRYRGNLVLGWHVGGAAGAIVDT